MQDENVLVGHFHIKSLRSLPISRKPRARRSNSYQSRIANSGTNLQADSLKVWHHSSVSSSSSTFLSKVQPKTSVIEVGAGNSYGHPTSATLGRLAQVGSAVYRSDLNGDILMTIDGMGPGHAGNQPGLGRPEHLPGQNSSHYWRQLREAGTGWVDSVARRRLNGFLRWQFHTVVHPQCNDRAQYCNTNDQQEAVFSSHQVVALGSYNSASCSTCVINCTISFIL